MQSAYLGALKLVTLFSIAFAPGISLSQLPKVTDRHLMCATILSQTPSLARYNEDFKYTWNAFSTFKSQFQKSLPMKLQERVAREDSPEIFYKGDKPMNADESVRLLARLASITNQPKTLKEIIGIHLQGEQQIAEFISNLTYSYKTVELMKKTSAAERNAQHRRFAMLATIVYTGFNASLIFGDESLYLKTFAASMTAMTWGSIKLSGALDHVINSFQFRDRQIAQSLNGIQNRILESPDDSSQLSQNPQTFAYLGFQALLPQQTIQEALRLSTYPNQELNIDRVISFVGSMKSRPREGMSQRMFELFQPKWVGFDFYFDFKNPEEPELFIAIRILPHKPPPEKIHQPAKAPTPPKAGSEKQSGLVGG